jgi:hypothetical protein
MTVHRYRFNPQTLSYEKVNKTFPMRRKIFLFIIIVAILYFGLGYILVFLEKLDQNKFLNFAAIVGSIASVIGLFSFFSKRLDKSDIENIGLEYFRDIVQTADKIKEKEKILRDKDNQLTSKERQIQELEIKKAELEFVIKKASMTIFLKDQLERLEDRIGDLIVDNKELSKNIQDRKDIIKQLTELEENIESSNNSELVDELISMIKKKEDEKPKDSLLMSILNKYILLIN